MKKMITGLLVGTAALALSACGGEAPVAEEAVVETETEVVPEEAMSEEMAEDGTDAGEGAGEDAGEIPLDGTGTPIGPSAVGDE